MVAASPALGAEGPVLPCDGPSIPAAADVGAPPAVRVWESGSLGADWAPPACSGWTAVGFRTLIAVAGRFESGGMDVLLARLGAVSKTAGMRYWSVTDREWRTLIREAHATTDAGGARADFTPAEFVAGRSLAFSQTDNGSGTAGFRMRVVQRTATRLVLTTENTTTIRFALLPLFHAGDLQSVYVLDQLPGGTWLYYDLTRVGAGASSLAGGHAASGVNRAVAWFRHIAGIPTDREPPASP